MSSRSRHIKPLDLERCQSRTGAPCETSRTLIPRVPYTSRLTPLVWNTDRVCGGLIGCSDVPDQEGLPTCLLWCTGKLSLIERRACRA